jgi:hypothetical protein
VRLLLNETIWELLFLQQMKVLVKGGYAKLNEETVSIFEKLSV